MTIDTLGTPGTPSLTMRHRVQHPEEHSVLLGRAHLWHALRLPTEEHALFRSPPRKGKSGLLASIILRYPGPVLSTTTRADIYRNTVRARLDAGRVDTFNPQGIGRVPSTMAWDPISGCLDVATAIRRADAFAFAVSSQGMEDGAFWASKTSDYLRALFYAAAYARTRGARYGLLNATRWALSNASQEAEEILQDAGAHDWSEQVGELRGPAEKTTQTVRMYMSRALSFMMDPGLAHAVMPRDDDPGLDLESFARGQNTLYMIAQGQGENSPLAALFSCLAGEIHYAAGLVGSWNDSGRLRRPMLFALDEVTQIVPVDLPGWMADSGGKGIQVIAVVHGDAQLRRKWGANGARQILDCAGCEVVLPGVRDPETLKSLSTLCGTVALKEHQGEHYGRHPVMTEDMIRCLPKRHALVIRDGLSPVIARISQVWDNRLYKRLKREPLPDTRRPPVPPRAIVGTVVPPKPAPGPAGGSGDFPWPGAA